MSTLSRTNKMLAKSMSFLICLTKLQLKHTSSCSNVLIKADIEWLNKQKKRSSTRMTHGFYSRAIFPYNFVLDVFFPSMFTYIVGQFFFLLWFFLVTFVNTFFFPRCSAERLRSRAASLHLAWEYEQQLLFLPSFLHAGTKLWKQNPLVLRLQFSQRRKGHS